MDFEKKLHRLEEIVKQMEEGDLSLEDSLRSFEEGVKLAKKCQEELSAAEQRVKVLVSVNESGEGEFKEFNLQEE